MDEVGAGDGGVNITHSRCLCLSLCWCMLVNVGPVFSDVVILQMTQKWHEAWYYIDII